LGTGGGGKNFPSVQAFRLRTPKFEAKLFKLGKRTLKERRKRLGGGLGTYQGLVGKKVRQEETDGYVENSRHKAGGLNDQGATMPEMEERPKSFGSPATDC